MALSQHHVSNRSAQDYLKNAVFVVLVTSIWAAMMATADGIDWSIFLTTVIISKSAEAKITPHVLVYHPIVTSRFYSNEQNGNKILAEREVTSTSREIAPDSSFFNGKRLQMAKTSSENILNKYRPHRLLNNFESEQDGYSSPSFYVSHKEPGAITSDTRWYAFPNSRYENRHFIRRRSVGPNACPEIQDSQTCSCREGEVFCNGLNISILVFSAPLPTDVKHISASRNHLRSIPVLSGAPNLHELSLDQNEIQMANLKELSKFTMLEKLDFSSNKLEELDLSEGTFLCLQKLNASFNNLTRIESQPLGLTHLYLQKNMLSDVFFLSRFRFLEYLNLSFNRINYIPLDIFQNLTVLYSLDLRNNLISNADFVPYITKVLHTLAISNNRISSFPVKSFKDSKIVFLYLDNNTLTNVNFLIYSNAAEINLNDNRLFNLNGKVFENKNKLKVLNVSGTNLTSINFITSIPSLISVGMESNNISCLPKGFLKNYRSLKEWFLLDNPLEDLICPVSSEWTIEEMCNISVSNNKVQIRMNNVNINDIMRCVLDHRHVFEDCEQKCNFASHTLFPPLLIFVSTLFSVI